MNPDRKIRNVLVTHQFVTGASRCDSEELSVGGTDNVDASVFAGFDYVALGHIHGPQNIGDAVKLTADFVLLFALTAAVARADRKQQKTYFEKTCIKYT